MPPEGLLFGSCVFFGFLAIGVAAMKSNNRKLLAIIAGLMVGLLLGLFLAMFWAAFTGNLVMGENEYERRKEAWRGFLFIIGYTGLIGAAIGLIKSSFVNSKNKEIP